MSFIPKAGETYRHFKGNLYKVIAIAKHTETEEELVIYQSVEHLQEIYARPLEMFTGKVDKEKYPQSVQEYRFERYDSMQNSEEVNIDPMVLEFLEADTYEQKLNILAGLHHRITDEMITTMAVASDVEVAEGDLEERYESLKACLLTFDKYECSRLR